jgi:hypothetical protein
MVYTFFGDCFGRKEDSLRTYTIRLPEKSGIRHIFVFKAADTAVLWNLLKNSISNFLTKYCSRTLNQGLSNELLSGRSPDGPFICIAWHTVLYVVKGFYARKSCKTYIFEGGIFLCAFFNPGCFICCPSDTTVSENAGIELRTVVTLALTARRSTISAHLIHNSVRSHPRAKHLLCIVWKAGNPSGND